MTMTALTTAQFEQQMEAITSHYRLALQAGGSVTEYELPKEIVEAAKRPGLQLSADDLNNWKHELCEGIVSFCDYLQSLITAAVNQCKQDQNNNAFDHAMDDAGNQGQQQAAQKISQWYSEGRALGARHPESQEEIANAFANAMGYFFMNVVHGIMTFIKNAVADFVSWIETGVEAVLTFFSGLVQAVRDYFSKL